MPSQVVHPKPDDHPLMDYVLAARSQYRAMIPLAGTPEPVGQVKAIAIPATHPDRIITARLYAPATSQQVLPIVVFVHGGGFISGDLDTHEALIHAIANGVGALVLSVNYRLAPEHPFPAGLEDVYAALRYASEQANQWGGDGQRLAICGDSAGGNIAAATALLARDREGPRLNAQWLMYATLSNTMDSPSWYELGDSNFPTRADNEAAIACYVPSGISPTSPLVAPLWADLRDLPSTLVQVGNKDSLLDENISFVHALEKVGVEANVQVFRGQKHGFIQFFKDWDNHSQGEAALQEGVAFLKSQLG